MAIPADTVWEVQTGGSNSACGGGYASSMHGATGVDRTQQAAAQYTYSSLSSSGTTVTGTGFTNDILGNVMQVTGTGAGFYCITGFTNSTTITIDRAPGTPFSGSTGYVGGALATPAQAASVATTSNTIYVKAGTYTVSTQTTTPAGSSSAMAYVVGYSTNRTLWNTDTAPVIQTSANITVISQSGYCQVNNLNLQQTGTVQGQGINTNGGQTAILNCYASGFDKGIYMQGSQSFVYNCEAVSCNTGIYTNNNCNILGCYVNGCGTGIYGGGTGVTVLNCVMVGCTTCACNLYQYSMAVNCSAYNCVNGFILNAGGAILVTHVNCVCTNSTYGFKGTGSLKAESMLINCAGYNNSSGNYHTTAYTSANNLGFIALTASPYNAPTASPPDLSLNSTAGGGAALKNAGYPTNILGLSTAGLQLNVGAFMSAGGGGVATPFMRYLGA